jgi:NADH:ubiquinone oxidoreductase subunit
MFTGLWRAMQRWLNKIITLFAYKSVGKDSFGNEYYESLSCDRAFGRKARKVLYKGVVEASKIPSVWNAWLTFQTDEIPEREFLGYRWEKPHTPNLSGTRYAYFPPGHLKAEGKRKPATGDYQRWKP